MPMHFSSPLLLATLILALIVSLVYPTHSTPLPHLRDQTSRQNAPSSSTSSSDIIARIRDSHKTTRLAALFAALPVAFCMLSHCFLVLGRHRNLWSVSRIGIIFLIASKLIAIPLGLLLLSAGLVLADLEISLVGVSSLALIYAAHVGSWNGAARLYILLLWSPDVFDLQRWHVDGRGDPRVFGKDDPYRRGAVAIRRLVSRASEENSNCIHDWTDELIIALLAVKFVSLTVAELNWRESPHGPSVTELLQSLARWDKGWSGQPGKWLREWTMFEEFSEVTPTPTSSAAPPTPSAASIVSGPAAAPGSATGAATPSRPPYTREQASALYEKTLRFVVVLFECIRRSKISKSSTQRREILGVLGVRRNMAHSDMQWFYDLTRRCLDGDDRALDKTVGPTRAS